MKTRIYLVLVIILCLAVLVFVWWPRRAAPPEVVPPDVPSFPGLPEGGVGGSQTSTKPTDQTTIDLGRFFEVASEITPQGDAVVTDHKSYRIYFNQADEAFIITLLQLPVEESRLQAEADLFKYLEMSKEEICRLKVSVGSPYWVDPGYSRNLSQLDLCVSQ